MGAKYTNKLTITLNSLDVTEYVDAGATGSFVYDLVASANHSGSSIEGGHYYAFVKKTDQWYEFNDSHVTPLDGDSFRTSPGAQTDAYILFYKLRE